MARLLLDTCVPRSVGPQLAAKGHDVESVGEWPIDPGDDAILATANQSRRVLVTLDKDFGELAVRRGCPHAGIIRLIDLAAREQASLCARVLEQYSAELESGALITADRRRIRVRG